jgi:hypothetical protein
MLAIQEIQVEQEIQVLQEIQAILELEPPQDHQVMLEQ